VTGPLTNPDQTAIDPSFGVQFFDHQRSVGVKYTRTISPHLTFETSLGYIRSTPFFPAVNHTQPAIGFGDGLFSGLQLSVADFDFGSYGTCINSGMTCWLAWLTHVQVGVEVRLTATHDLRHRSQRAYSFGGGTAYPGSDCLRQRQAHIQAGIRCPIRLRAC